MKCRDIMSTNLETLSERDTIADAAKRMEDAGVGFLPICGADQKVVGVVTDRDLVTRALAKGVNPNTTSAAMVMSSPALTCLADADLASVEEMMARERKARIILTNPDGTLVGIVSVADLIEHAPSRGALATIKAMLWREALGPRAGAARGETRLRDMPIAPASSDEISPHGSVFSGGHHDNGSKEFPT
jgi:CBS domain-containing protein